MAKSIAKQSTRNHFVCNARLLWRLG